MAGYVTISGYSYSNKLRAGLICYDGQWHLNTIDLQESHTDNECTIAEYGNKSVIINARNLKGSRSVYWTQLDSISFKKHPSDRTFQTLNMYGCQGSIIKYNDCYLFTYVDVTNTSYTRANLCVWITYDLCTFYPLVYISLNKQIGGYANLYYNEANGNLYCVYESNAERTEISLVDITENVTSALANNNAMMMNMNDYFGSIIASHRKELL